jgi:hypothetical protein
VFGVSFFFSLPLSFIALLIYIIMKYLITLLAFLSSAFALVPPQPTKTIEQVPSIQTQATPTQQPERYAYKWSKRDVDDTLSMYENWANDCNDDDSNVNIAVSGGVNNLWQTVTNTVYCGNGNVKTVTKTVTAKATETATASKGVGGGKKSKDSCDAKCWSTYLWRKLYI